MPSSYPRPTLYRVFSAVVIFLSFAFFSAATSLPSASTHKRNSNPGYNNPLNSDGSMLTQVLNTYPAGLGEPLNVIISAYSDSRVLQDTGNNGGLINYFQSFGFSTECLGQHTGDSQMANLGDGKGWENQTSEIRWDYNNVSFGTCQETIEGGNHFRYWIQDGPDADSGAIFLAVSYELPVAEQHDIIANGYNLGRDWLVGNATSQSSIIPTAKLTNTSTYSGRTSFNGYNYHTSVVYVSGLLANSSQGVNHYQGVATNKSFAIDGLVAVLTVQIESSPSGINDTELSRQPALLFSVFATSMTLFFATCLF